MRRQSQRSSSPLRLVSRWAHHQPVPDLAFVWVFILQFISSYIVYILQDFSIYIFVLYPANISNSRTLQVLISKLALNAIKITVLLHIIHITACHVACLFIFINQAFWSVWRGLKLKNQNLRLPLRLHWAL